MAEKEFSVFRKNGIGWKWPIVIFLFFPAFSALSGTPTNDVHARACEEIRILQEIIPGFSIIPFQKSPGNLQLQPEQSLTADKLRGVELDPAPPQIGEPSPSYRQLTSLLTNSPASVIRARDIRPFRFRYFDCEFHHDGQNQVTWPLNEYAAIHGFNRLSFYKPAHEHWTHLPPGTDWARISGYHWNGWFKSKGLEMNRWDLLAAAKARGEDIVPPGKLKVNPLYSRHIVDMEFGGLLPLEELRRQSWYPADQNPTAREQFEANYYDGFALSYCEPGRAARRDGWPRAGIYAWQSFRQTWYGLDKRIQLDPAIPWVKRFLNNLFDTYDLIYIDGYCYEWSPRNVAHELLSMDEAFAFGATHKQKRSIRLYFSPVILNRPEAGNWMRHQPLPNEDVRAIVAFQFFIGTDGFVYWNFAGAHDPALPPDILARTKGAKNQEIVVQVGHPFRASLADLHKPVDFQRHDFLHILDIDEASGHARFRKIDPTRRLEDQPPEHDQIAVLPMAKLRSRLRSEGETVPAVIEGMALARGLEYTLRHGEAKTDIDMRKAWENILPLARRIRLKDLHLVATYDPGVVHGGKPRPVELKDFDGVTGLNLVLPADDQLRIFVLKESAATEPR